MQYQGIIFDLDGVLCSTDEYHYRAWKALADRLGIPFDRERNGLLRGVSRMEHHPRKKRQGVLAGREKRDGGGEKHALSAVAEPNVAR